MADVNNNKDSNIMTCISGGIKQIPCFMKYIHNEKLCGEDFFSAYFQGRLTGIVLIIESTKSEYL